LARGQNRFSVIATDPVTQRESTPLPLSITVPLPTASPGSSGAPATQAPPPPITMTLFGPADGFTTTDPNIVISGTTTGTRITIGSTYVGTPPATLAPTGLPVATPAPGASSPPTPSASPPPAGPTADITVTSGSFSQSLRFPVGRWRLTITSYATGLSPVAQEVEVDVQQPPVTLYQLDIHVAGNRVSLKVKADGTVVPELDGVAVNDGDQFSILGTREFCVRTNNAGAISLTLDDETLGLLGSRGQNGSWIVTPGQAPIPATTPC
jgi:hypothetical protein